MPDGWTIGPPGFVGVGVQKGGTSWWFTLLQEHPNVYRSVKVKELHYFDRFFEGSFGQAEIDAYHRYFPRPRGGLTGEWTPEYLVDFWVPPLLQLAAPDARLLVMLRDPVARFESGLEHARRRGWPINRNEAGNAFQRGMYAQQLTRLHATFPPDRTLVLQYERCQREPEAHLRRTFEFLGLEPVEIPRERIEQRVGVPKRGKARGIDPTLRETVRRAYEPDVRELTRLVPEIDLSLWPSFSGL